MPKFGYADNSSQGGDDPTPLHTLDDYLAAQVRSLMERPDPGIPANQSYNEAEFSSLIRRIKEDLENIVDLENDSDRGKYVEIYCAAYGLEKLRL